MTVANSRGERVDGVWVAYFTDRSAVVPFASELEALRFAVTRSMDVAFVPYGTYIADESAGWAEARKEGKS